MLAHENEEGFSLIEVLIAMFVFTVGVLAVISMQVTSLRGNSKSRATTEAVTVGQNILEEQLGLNYEDITDTNGDGIAGLDSIAINADSTTTINRYTASWNVAEDTPRNGIKTVRVIVNWDERTFPKTLTMTSIKVVE